MSENMSQHFFPAGISDTIPVFTVYLWLEEVAQ
jgi:hypothetical protein